MIESQDNLFLGILAWDLIAALFQIPSMIELSACFCPYIFTILLWGRAEFVGDTPVHANSTFASEASWRHLRT